MIDPRNHADKTLSASLRYLSLKMPLIGNGKTFGGYEMIAGSCCCGAIAFELSEPPKMMGTCHCSRCRKAGASTIVFVRAATFRWIRGQDMVQRYEAVPPYKYDRCFCSRCGTALGEPGSGESFPINANCFDDDPQVRVQFHEFVAEKPAWYEICDLTTQFDEYPINAEQ